MVSDQRLHLQAYLLYMESIATRPVRRSLILWIILLTSFVNPFMGSAVNLALPLIGRELGMNALSMGWVAMAFLLTSAVLMVPMGRLSDHVGRRKIYVIGNYIFALATLVCAFSPGSIFLIGGRLLQGLGGAMMFATSMALITEIYPPRERGRAIGTTVTAVYLGLSLAPAVGGFLVNSLGWRSIFWMTFFPVLAAALMMHFLIKGEWKSQNPGAYDHQGAWVYVIAMSLFMYGFSHLPSLPSLVLSMAGLGGLFAFVRIENKADFPVFDVHLLSRNRLFALSNLAALINYAITFAVTFMLSLYLYYVKGLNPRDAGLILMAQPAIMALVAYFSGRLSDYYDPRWLSSAGMFVITLCLIGLVFLSPETPVGRLALLLGIMGFGFGLFSSPNTNAIMGSVEKKYLGTASATVGTMRLTGQMMSMGIATLVINVFLGKGNIHSGTLHLFLQAQETLFGVFVLLGVLGIWASLARGSRYQGVSG